MATNYTYISVCIIYGIIMLTFKQCLFPSSFLLHICLVAVPTWNSVAGLQGSHVHYSGKTSIVDTMATLTPEIGDDRPPQCEITR